MNKTKTSIFEAIFVSRYGHDRQQAQALGTAWVNVLDHVEALNACRLTRKPFDLSLSRSRRQSEKIIGFAISRDGWFRQNLLALGSLSHADGGAVLKIRDCTPAEWEQYHWGEARFNAAAGHWDASVQDHYKGACAPNDEPARPTDLNGLLLNVLKLTR